MDKSRLVFRRHMGRGLGQDSGWWAYLAVARIYLAGDIHGVAIGWGWDAADPWRPWPRLRHYERPWPRGAVARVRRSGALVWAGLILEVFSDVVVSDG